MEIMSKYSLQNDENWNEICKDVTPVLCETCGRTTQLKAQLKNDKRTISRLRRLNLKYLIKIKKLKQQVNSCKFNSECYRNIPEKQNLIITEIFNASKNKGNSKGNRYSEEWILDALLLKIKSNSTYTYLRNNNYLPLPSPITLHKFISVFKTEFGFDDSFFSLLSIKLKGKQPQQLHGLLVWDEMKVQSAIQFNWKTGYIQGYVEYGEFTENEQNKLADHVLVFLFIPITDSWIQTVSVFPSAAAAPGSVIAKLLLKCVLLLENSGAFVDAACCDGSQTNKNMQKSLGLSGRINNVRNHIPDPVNSTKKLYFLYDIPDLFKCIRNQLFNIRYYQVW